MPDHALQGGRAKVTVSERAARAKLHVAKKRLGLDDEVYRAVLQKVTGKSSSADLDGAELGRVLDEFQRLGFREGASFSAKLEDFGDRWPQARFVRALWTECAALGLFRDTSERALRRFIKRQAKVESINWLTPRGAAAVITALKVMKSRHKQKRSQVVRESESNWHGGVK